MTCQEIQLPGEAKSLRMGDSLLEAGAIGPVWRVTRGVFRLERVSDEGVAFVQLALPGDLLGVEALCSERYSFSATAVVDSEAVPLALADDAARHRVLADAFLQQQARTAEAVRLRSGTVASRVDHFLTTLAHATGVITQRVRDCDLPYLRDIAHIVDSAPESVCRAMGGLVAPRTRARPARRKLDSALA